MLILAETEVKNEVQDCPETDSVPSGELYIDENAEEKEQEYPDSMEKADYSSLYGANQYYNRHVFLTNYIYSSLEIILILNDKNSRIAIFK